MCMRKISVGALGVDVRLFPDGFVPERSPVKVTTEKIGSDTRGTAATEVLHIFNGPRPQLERPAF